MLDSMASLRSRFVRGITADDRKPTTHASEAFNVRLDRESGPPPPPGGCVSATASAWPAYAILAGIPPDRLASAEFLLDPSGWLRALRRPGEPPDWNDPITLGAAIRGMREQPITAVLGGLHVHGQ